MLSSTRIAITPPFVRDPLWLIARQVPALDLNFAKNKSLVNAKGESLVTFTRASSATFVGSDGTLQTAVTNLLLRSEEFDNASWVKYSVNGPTAPVVTANQSPAPNGSVIADKVVLPAVSGAGARCILYQTATLSASTTYFISCYLKGDVGGEKVWVGQTNNSVWSSVQCNLTTSWQRFSFAFTTSTAGAYFVTIGVDLFDGSQTAAAAQTFYAWGAQLEQASTVGEYIPTTSAINSAPRFDHNPTTRESLGLLVEEQRTNEVRNSNSMTAVVTGSPGTLPTGWSAQGNTGGWTREVVAAGSLGSLNYVDIRFSGTPTGGTFAVVFQTQGIVAASNGQSWAASVYHQLVGGAISNITGFPAANLWNSSSGFIGSLAVTGTIVPTSTLQRFSGSGTIGLATTAFISWGITFTCTIGNTYDFTIRFAGPQLELGAFTTSFIPTTGTAATRAADVASITGTNFSSWYNQTEGTMYAESRSISSADSSGISGAPCVFSNGSNTERIRVGIAALQATWVAGNVTQATLSSGAGFVANNLFRCAAATKANDLAFTINANTVQSSNSALVPSVSQLNIGTSNFNAGFLNGTIRRLTYWSTRLPNTTLQQVTK
jgi:hypothetical protein